MQRVPTVKHRMDVGTRLVHGHGQESFVEGHDCEVGPRPRLRVRLTVSRSHSSAGSASHRAIVDSHAGLVARVLDCGSGEIFEHRLLGGASRAIT